MALDLHKQRLQQFVLAMLNQGIVNAGFLEMQSMKEVVRPDFVVRTITMYCLAAQNLFTLLTLQLNQSNCNFSEVQVYACDMFERSSSVGAEHVLVACADIIRGSQAFDKEYCSQALTRTKNEFSRLRRDLETIVQMERKIIDLQNGIETRILS